MQRIAKQRREAVAIVRPQLEKDGTIRRIAQTIRTEKTLSMLFENARKEAPRERAGNPERRVKMPGPVRYDSEFVSIARWLPTLSMMLVSLISYIDRITLALLAPDDPARDRALRRGVRLDHLRVFRSRTCSAIRSGAAFSTASASARGMLASVAVWSVASASHVVRIRLLELRGGA